MTRINLDHPENLTDQHLIAEYRELPRIFTMVLAAQERGETPETYGIPATFTLGKGHMKFFADKLLYLSRRQSRIVEECIDRGVNINHDTMRHDILGAIKHHWYNDYKPSPEALALSRERIQERIDANRKLYTMRGVKLYPEHYETRNAKL